VRRAAVIVALLAVAGCGSGGGGTSATAPKSSASGGDEEPIRVPATFTLRDGRLSPATISVPAFLTVRLAVVGHDERSHEVVAQTDHGPRTLRVPPGASGAITIPGMRRGTYRVSVDGGREVGKLVVGANAGP
jgi:Cupredoxin-like domain